MPSKENEPKAERPQGDEQERESVPYCQAVRFPSDEPARATYFKAQEAIFGEPECDLSAYRFQSLGISYVAVLGDQPPEKLAQILQTILSSGEPVTLPPGVFRALADRRKQVTEHGPTWVEGHYRDGGNL